MKGKLKRLWRKIRSYLVFIAIALGVGGASALITRDAMAAFEALRQPPLAPPGWLFAPVWTVLYTLMGISAGLIWRKAPRAERDDALFLWGIQLLVNFFWPIFYFKLEYRLFAFFWLLLLLALVVAMTVKFLRLQRTAGLLQIPYILWLAFAAYLNLGVYLLNR